MLDGVKPRVVRVKDVPESALWVHDEHDRATGLVLGQLWAPEYPIPLGVMADDDGLGVGRLDDVPLDQVEIRDGQ